MFLTGRAHSADLPTLEATLGANGVVQEGAWSGAQVRLRTRNDPFEGNLRLVHQKRGFPEVVIVKPVEMPRFNIQDISLQIALGVPLFESLSLELENRGRIVLTQPLAWRLSALEPKTHDPVPTDLLNKERKAFAARVPPSGNWQRDLAFVLSSVVCFALFVVATKRRWKTGVRKILALVGVLLFVYSSGIGRATAKNSAFAVFEFQSVSGLQSRLYLVYLASRAPFEIHVPPGQIPWFPDPVEASRVLEQVRVSPDNGMVTLVPRIAGARAMFICQPVGTGT